MSVCVCAQGLEIAIAERLCELEAYLCAQALWGFWLRCELTVCVCVCVCVCVAQGLDAAIAERLCEWRIEFKDIRVCPADDALLAADQAVALRNTLRQFGDLQTSDGAVVTLSRWQWTADTVQVAAEALPALPHLTFGLYTPQPLTDELLRHVVSMGPRMRYLTVDSLSLQSSHHRIKWPWDQLSIQTVDVIQLTKLPNPRGSKWTRHIDAHNISLRKAAKLGPVRMRAYPSAHKHCVILYVYACISCTDLTYLTNLTYAFQTTVHNHSGTQTSTAHTSCVLHA